MNTHFASTIAKNVTNNIIHIDSASKFVMGLHNGFKGFKAPEHSLGALLMDSSGCRAMNIGHNAGIALRSLKEMKSSK